jgi:hypothetical protein
MEELEMKMRQSKNPRWVYEWPMKTPKVKWPVRELMVKGQQRLLKIWLRYAENLRPIEEEEMVYICEPEIGGILSEEDKMRSAEDLMDCQEDSEGISDCQEGNRRFPICQVGEETKTGSTKDLMDCQEDSGEISICQEGNEKRSLWDLKDCREGIRSIEDCQEGSGSVLNCQEGRDENLGPSEDPIKSSIQQGVLMKMGSVDLIVCQGSNEKHSILPERQG